MIGVLSVDRVRRKGFKFGGDLVRLMLGQSSDR